MKQRWMLVNFSEAPLEIIDGDRGKNYPQHTDFSDDGFCLFLNAGNVSEAGFSFMSTQFINQAKDDTLRKGRLKRDDVVMTTRGTIGNVAHYGKDVPFEHMRINSGMVIFRCDRSQLSPQFLHHLLRTPSFHGQVNSLRSGVAQPQLPIRDIKRIEIPLPPLTEQMKVADVLSAYDEMIENNRRRMGLLEEEARLLYQEWFVRLRFPGHELSSITNDVPQGWRKATAYDAMEVMSGGTPKTTNPDFWDGDIPFYTPKDSVDTCYVLVTEKHLTELGLSKCNSSLYPKDTVFITARGTVGNLNLAQRPMAMNQSCYALVGRDGLPQKFLLCALRDAIQQFQQHAVGAVFDAIIVDTFKLITFVIPDSRLVELFEETVQPIFQQAENLLLQNQKLRTARDLLLPRLMSGELTV